MEPFDKAKSEIQGSNSPQGFPALQGSSTQSSAPSIARRFTGFISGVAQHVTRVAGFDNQQSSVSTPPPPPSVHLAPSQQQVNLPPSSIQNIALSSVRGSSARHHVGLASLRACNKPKELSGPQNPVQLSLLSAPTQSRHLMPETDLESETKAEPETKARENESPNVSYLSDELSKFAPNLVDPQTSLHSLLKIDDTMSSIFAKKPPLKLVQQTESGLSGKIKFVQFKDDPNATRSFAIKRPNSIGMIFSSDNTAKLNYYKNNLAIANKVGAHPNFMKVHGVIVKIKAGARSKPYLILEHIKGTILRNCGPLSQAQKIDLMRQLKAAFLHLYELKILPIDLNHGNVIITNQNQLKLIDFDAWQEGAPNEKLAVGLHKAASSIAQKLGLQLPSLHGTSREDLERALTASL